MTHYEIDYSTMPEGAEKDAKAVADIREYLGAKPWLALMELAAKETTTIQTLHLNLSFCGVQGFPVSAFLRTYRANSFQAWWDMLPE